MPPVHCGSGRHLRRQQLQPPPRPPPLVLLIVFQLIQVAAYIRFQQRTFKRLLSIGLKIAFCHGRAGVSTQSHSTEERWWASIYILGPALASNLWL